MSNEPQAESNWQDLAIANAELERHSGLEITEQFIGGLWLGVIRYSCWRSRSKIFTLFGTEVMVILLLMMFSLPMGLAVTRSSDTPPLRRFVGGMVASTVLLYGGRVGWRSRKQRSLHRLQKLVDDVEQFNQVAESIALLSQLHGLGTSPTSPLAENHELLNSLQVTRDHLILGLKLDQQLRQHQKQLIQHPDLLEQLATQIASLQVLQKQSETQEYGQVLNQLIQISRSVEQELSGD